jgi:uncharacterized protein (UPF0303 family)
MKKVNDMDILKDLKKIQAQENALQLDRFDMETAWRLGSIVRQLAAERGHAIAVEVRRGTLPVFFTYFEGATANNADWIRRKTNSTMHFERSTYALGLDYQQRGVSVSTRTALPERDFVTDGGCFPLRVKNAGLVGTLTVSGLDQRADHELAVEALCKLLGKNYKQLAL